MKKILCPTDFSDTAQNAVAYAAKLAQAMHADLTLLNVQSVFDFTPVEVVRGKDITLAGAAERLEAEARAHAAEAEVTAGRAVRVSPGRKKKHQDSPMPQRTAYPSVVSRLPPGTTTVCDSGTLSSATPRKETL